MVEPAARGEQVSFRLAETVGSFGSALGQFNCPGGIAVDPEGNLYVADSRNDRIQKITPGGEVYGLGGPGVFVHPQAIVVDGARFMYVIEQGANRLQKFGPRGQFILAIGGPRARIRRFASPTAACLDIYHQIYIADTDNNRVTCYTNTGRWVTDFHGPTADLAFARPQGVAVDPQGRLYVADTMHHRVVRLTPEGLLDAVIGRPGPEPGELAEPRGLAVDPDGGIWVADTGNDRVQKFGPDGDLRCCFPPAPTPGLDLSCPRSVAVDGRGSVYVSDSMNHRIVRLVPAEAGR